MLRMENPPTTTAPESHRAAPDADALAVLSAASQPRTFSALRRALFVAGVGLRASATTALLARLVSGGLLRRTGDQFELTPAGRQVLMAGG